VSDAQFTAVFSWGFTSIHTQHPNGSLCIMRIRIMKLFITVSTSREGLEFPNADTKRLRKGFRFHAY